MTVNNFKPAIWAGDILENLNKELVYAQSSVVNRDYEGIIKQYGDEVEIFGIGRINSKTYSPGSDIDAPDDLQSSLTKIKIDQRIYFNVHIDDVDKRQAKPYIRQRITQEAAYSIKNTIDQYVANLYTDASLNNLIGNDSSPKTINSPNLAYECLVDLGVKLSKCNIPKKGRWVIVPPDFMGYMQKDDRFVKYTEASVDVLKNGLIARAAGFDIYESNNVPVTSGTGYFKIMAGHPKAISVAFQIPPGELEAYRPEKRFEDALKGLCLYGAKVVRPDALAVLTAALS
jgi:N4-gp56 family major capsid protein